MKLEENNIKTQSSHFNLENYTELTSEGLGPGPTFPPPLSPATNTQTLGPVLNMAQNLHITYAYPPEHFKSLSSS